jgi:hypothetical protein
MNRTILLAGALATLVSAACRTNTNDRYSNEDRFARQQAGTAGTAQRDFDDRYDSQNGKSMGTPREAGYSYGNNNGYNNANNNSYSHTGHGGMAYGGQNSARQTAGTAGTAQRDFDDHYDSGSAGQQNYGGQSYAQSGIGAGATAGTVASTSSPSQSYGGSTGPQPRSSTNQRDYDGHQDLNGRGAAGVAAGVGVAEASAPRQQNVESTIASWPASAQQAARQTISKYGPPNEVTNDTLVWNENGPWEKTIVHRQETDHNFPAPHKDVLEQTVTMRVPPENVEDLTRFDGSLLVNRTRGTITAICDREEMNFAAINLANDIVQGKRSVEQARDLLARTAAEVKNGQRPDLVQRFQFDVPRAKTGDPASRYTDDPSRRASGVIDSNPPKPLDKQNPPKDDTIDKEHPNKPNMDEVPDKPGDSSTQKDDLDNGPGA